MNQVIISGTVKRDANASNGFLDFALVVPGEKRADVFDCWTSDRTDAYRELEGFVSEGEELTVIGHLCKRTWTAQDRLAGDLVEVKATKTIVFVDNIGED